MSEFTDRLRELIAAEDAEHESNAYVPIKRQSYPEHVALVDFLEECAPAILAVVEAGGFHRNVITMRRGDEFNEPGAWVVIPRVDFDAFRAALVALERPPGSRDREEA